MEQTNHITEETRKFICLESFYSEGRYCNKGETYTAYPIEGGDVRMISWTRFGRI